MYTVYYIYILYIRKEVGKFHVSPHLQQKTRRTAAIVLSPCFFSVNRDDIL